MFTAMADAYKVQQVQGVSLSPFELWYLATLGGARALSLDEETGSLERGNVRARLLRVLTLGDLVGVGAACTGAGTGL